MSTNNRDARLSNRAQSEERQSRGEDERRPAATERVVTDEDRLEMFRSTLFQNTLPTLPPIDGYHICWLTTTNERDTIAMRMRLGYEPVKPEEVPGWENMSLKTGEYAGLIGINEMVAYKLPMRLYLMYMREAHADRPMSEEEKLKSVLEVIAEQAKAKGAKVELGEGSAQLGKNPLRPSFQEIP